MKEIFEDLIKKIEERTPCIVDYVESDEFCGIEIFKEDEDRLTGRFRGKFGIDDEGFLIMLVSRGRNAVCRRRSLCEPGDPIKIIIKFMKKEMLTEGEHNNWTLHDTMEGNKRVIELAQKLTHNQLL